MATVKILMWLLMRIVMINHVQYVVFHYEMIAIIFCDHPQLQTDTHSVDPLKTLSITLVY